ncbi:hypothetical protein [Polaribacter sp. R77954]|uniref:hypothetical protein n=1 Tax=Polaribacter sp. R77954 TaxID=3093870 RepID=UPI0037C82D55
MKKFKFNKDFKYKFTLAAISLLVLISVLSYQFTNENFYIISSFIGFLSLIAIIISISGFIRSLKKLNKPKSKERILSFIVISITACLLLYIIIENLIKAIKFIL